VRVKYRLIEISESGEIDHGEVPMAGWTDRKNAGLANNFSRSGNAFVRNQATDLGEESDGGGLVGGNARHGET
jgi:hypothetical protein